ncbi:type VI secretion system tube protein TssD [Morganella morganii]|uniref:type VI secretion system tube protein TssD n=1 Tax=Morganella morganii TaxID=582 RepID=UPI00339C0484
MSRAIYLSVTGENQGLISQGASSGESLGCYYQPGHEDEIYITSLEQRTSRRDESVNRNVIFTKLIDSASPLLFEAIQNNEELKMYFNFMENGSIKKSTSGKGFIKSIDEDISDKNGIETVFVDLYEYKVDYFNVE